MYCNHLEEAQKAVTRGNYAAKQSVKLKKLRNILKDEDFKILQTHSTNDKIEVFVLPGNVYVVPSLAPPSHDNPLRFIHIRNQKCPLSTCKEKKSKLHTLTQKDNPLCIHTILTNYISGKEVSTPVRSESTPVKGTVSPSPPPPPPRSSSTAVPPTGKKVKHPKLNRELTVKEMIKNIQHHFPTLSQLDSTSFVHQSRMFVEQLISSKNINEIVQEHSRKQCTVCSDSVLEEWQFKPKQSFILRDAISIQRVIG